MDTFVQDFRYSLRMFLRSPVFTIAAIATLAIGIGANTAVFSLVNTVLLKPLPLPEPDQIVRLLARAPQGVNPGGSPAKFQHWSEQSDVLQNVTAFRNNTLNYTGGDIAEQFDSVQASAEYFSLFGAPIIQGRAFAPEEDAPGGTKVALISQEVWETRFGEDPDILGTTIDLSDDAYVVIGVVGAGFTTEFGPRADVWTPFQLEPNTSDQGHYFAVAARLRPGVTLDQADSRLGASSAAYKEKFPQVLSEDARFSVERFQDVFVRNVRPSLFVLTGAVALLLLIACANVGNLLLVRATGRRHEIAVRAAVGADRKRIVRQLLTESVLLSAMGGALGLAIGLVRVRALLAVNTANLPRVGPNGSLVGLDWRVLAFALGATLVTAVIFGIIPALQSSRHNLSGNLKESSGRSATGFRQNKARSLLVLVKVALALILVVGSALLVRTSISLADVDPGFDASNVLILRTSLSGSRFETTAGANLMIANGLERLRTTPGVESASATCCVPLQGGYGLPFVVVGRPLEDRPSHGGGGWGTSSPGYFDVFKIPIVRGRVFDERDTAATPPVVVINRTMAEQTWPDADPLDDRLIIGRNVMREFALEPERQIIGIVEDVKQGALSRTPHR